MSSEVTLFLIEDDDIDAMTVERALHDCRIGNPVVRAHDGLEALELLRAGKVPKPYVILLDLQMPRMNGHEFLATLRKEKEFSDAVVFVLTTSRSKEDIEISYENFVAGYFVKEASGTETLKIAELLKGYWRIAYLPEDGTRMGTL